LECEDAAKINFDVWPFRKVEKELTEWVDAGRYGSNQIEKQQFGGRCKNLPSLFMNFS